MKSINNFVLITTIGLIGLLSCGNNTNKAENMQDAFMLSDMPAEERVSQEAPSNASDVVRFIPPPIPGLPNYIATKVASTQYDDGVNKFVRSAILIYIRTEPNMWKEYCVRMIILQLTNPASGQKP